MNLSAPQPDCNQYTKKLYDFLSNPVFAQLRLNPRSLVPDDTSPGKMYYNTTDGIQIGNPSSGESGYSGASGFVQRIVYSVLTGSRMPDSWDFKGYICQSAATYPTGGTGSWTGDFDTGGTFDQIDLSSIVPEEATAILIKVRMVCDRSFPQGYFYIKPYDSEAAPDYQSVLCRFRQMSWAPTGSSPPYVNYFEDKYLIVPAPEDGVQYYDYERTADPSGDEYGIVYLAMYVCGWWV